MSDPIVIDWYRGMHWVENILINAVVLAFCGHLPPQLFHDIFGRVIPLDSDTLEKEKAREDPAKAAEVRRAWKDKIVEVVPDALQWSGILFINADMREWTWWYHERQWSHPDGRPFSDSDKAFMAIRVSDWRESRPSREISLFRLTRAQRKFLNITPTMVGGMDLPSWQVRTCPFHAMPILYFYTFVRSL